jgi:hypothetical protein
MLGLEAGHMLTCALRLEGFLLLKTDTAVSVLSTIVCWYHTFLFTITIFCLLANPFKDAAELPFMQHKGRSVSQTDGSLTVSLISKLAYDLRLRGRS